ncbi:MAG: phytanoyl-CoA dioxygenase family protein [Verrucomicrobiae bacterium]|nr:phytanoyl-CoA dioxygenase family protein [Verrucomicrobiae bacterium]
MRQLIKEDPRWKQSFDEDGFVVIRGFLDAEEVKEMKANIDRYVRDIIPVLESTEVFYEDKHRPETLKQLPRMHAHDAFFDRKVSQGKFKQLAEWLLGEGVAAKGVQYFNKPPRMGQPTPPHQDGFYWKVTPCEGVTMWLALEKVDKENGCLHYSRGSHRKGIREHGRTNTLGFSQGIVDFPNDDDRDGDRAVFAEAGDLLVHHAMTVHWASGNDSLNRSRKSLGIVYHAPGVVVDTVRRDAYQKVLHQDLQEAGKI